jgi:hypothetical protein
VYEWWLGRVLALYRTAGRAGKTSSTVDRVSLSAPLDGVKVVASWYEPTDRTRTVFKLSRRVQDKKRYLLSKAYLGAPRLDYDAEDGVCRLADAHRAPSSRPRLPCKRRDPSGGELSTRLAMNAWSCSSRIADRQI